MRPEVTCQPIRVAAIWRGDSEDGFLILADGALVAVVIHLQQSVTGAPKRHWYIEATFGLCQKPPSDELVFETPDRAKEWMCVQVQRQHARAALAKT
jgi:hypothetical protein